MDNLYFEALQRLDSRIWRVRPARDGFFGGIKIARALQSKMYGSQLAVQRSMFGEPQRNTRGPRERGTSPANTGCGQGYIYI